MPFLHDLATDPLQSDTAASLRFSHQLVSLSSPESTVFTNSINHLSTAVPPHQQTLAVHQIVLNF